MNTRLLLALLLASLILGSSACGRKVWPRPQQWEDAFSWEATSAQKVGDCMIIDGRIKGAWQNLESVTLQLEPVGPGQDCPTCPFRPVKVVELRGGSPMFGQDGPNVRIQYCGLDPSAILRWRLAAHSRFPTAPPEFSQVQFFPQDQY